MKAIILAAGRGTRLHDLTGGKPKCLLQLGNETVLEREIRLLQEAGIRKDDIYVVGGYCYELLEDTAPNLIINREFESKDNSYTLGLALGQVPPDDILVLDSDLCFEKDILTAVICDPRSNVLLSKVSGDLDESTGIVTRPDGRVTAIGKKYQDTGFVYISIFKISRDIIAPFRELLLDERSGKTWYTLAITDLCSRYEFYNLPVTGKWHEIDFREDYEETLDLFQLGGNRV